MTLAMIPFALSVFLFRAGAAAQWREICRRRREAIAIGRPGPATATMRG
jgi:hypothetical protein